MMSSLMMGGKLIIPASAMAAMDATPSSRGRGLRLRWMLMWIETGMPSSSATAKKASSSLPRSSSPLGQVVMTTPRYPISAQRVISSIIAFTPRFGIWATPNRRSGSTAQNSWASQSLYARMPARWKSTSRLPMK